MAENIPFQGWIATLSNGENVWEQPSPDGEVSAWQKLITRLNTENLKITSLRVQRGRITLTALPARRCDGYWQAYEQFMSMNSGAQYIRQGCGSVIGDNVIIHWIDQNGNVWLDIRSLQSEKPNTTLRDN